MAHSTLTEMEQSCSLHGSWESKHRGQHLREKGQRPDQATCPRPTQHACECPLLISCAVFRSIKLTMDTKCHHTQQGCFLGCLYNLAISLINSVHASAEFVFKFALATLGLLNFHIPSTSPKFTYDFD